MSNATKFYLWKRGECYYIGFKGTTGKISWKSTGCRFKSEALKELTKFKQGFSSQPKEKSLSQFSQEFLTYASSAYARGTCDIFAIGLKHLMATSGDCGLSQLTMQHIDKYKTKRLQEVKPNSVNAEVRGLRAILNIALRWKLVTENPFANVQLVDVPEMQPSYFSKEDFQRLLSVIKEGWLRDLVLFSVSTGMRRGEVLNLQWNSIDMERRQAIIQSTATFKTKKGKRRTIPINETACLILHSRFAKSTCPYVFFLNDGKVKESYVSHKIKDYIREAGLSEELHWHSLRHTTATWLVQDGVSLYQVQKLLGHSSPQTTEIYSHLATSDLQATVNRIAITVN